VHNNCLFTDLIVYANLYPITNRRTEEKSVQNRIRIGEQYQTTYVCYLPRHITTQLVAQFTVH
jgi:hypothetical protein